MDIGDMEKEYVEAQFAVAVALQKRVQELESENSHLKKMLEGTVPLIQNNTIDIGISNERIICETQIALLKNSAINRELSLEETRKLQIYVDVLEKISKKQPDDGINAEVSEVELLRLVKDESGK